MPAKKKTAKKTTKRKAVAKKATKKVAKKATKKATKKTAKKAVKKTAKKRSAKKPLVQASNSTSFWVSDGQILNSLLALKDALERMDKDVYVYHATGKHNDFANWVEVVLCDDKCAKDLRKAKTPRSAKTVVVKHLKLYSI